MAVRLQFRRGTATQWTTTDPVLAPGEPGLETDTRRVKYGDGARKWSALEYATGSTTTDAGSGSDGTSQSSVAIGIDGGTPTSVYGGTVPINGGGVV